MEVYFKITAPAPLKFFKEFYILEKKDINNKIVKCPDFSTHFKSVQHSLVLDLSSIQGTPTS